MIGREHRSRDVLRDIWTAPGTAPTAASRHLLYALRSIALLRSGHVELALKAREKLAIACLHTMCLTMCTTGCHRRPCIHARGGHCLRSGDSRQSCRKCTLGVWSQCIKYDFASRLILCTCVEFRTLQRNCSCQASTVRYRQLWRQLCQCTEQSSWMSPAKESFVM